MTRVRFTCVESAPGDELCGCSDSSGAWDRFHPASKITGICVWSSRSPRHSLAPLRWPLPCFGAAGASADFCPSFFAGITARKSLFTAPRRKRTGRRTAPGSEGSDLAAQTAPREAQTIARMGRRRLTVCPHRSPSYRAPPRFRVSAFAPRSAVRASRMSAPSPDRSRQDDP